MSPYSWKVKILYNFSKIFHIAFQQFLRNDLWDMGKSPIMASFKLSFFMD
jgi:hypothetical protein